MIFVLSCSVYFTYHAALQVNYQDFLQFIQKAVQEEKQQSVEVCQWAWQNYPVYYHFILSAACWWMFLNMILSGRDLGCVSGQYWPGISERQERCECRTKRNMAPEVPEDGDGLTNVWHPKHRYKSHHTNTVCLMHILKWFETLWLIENDRLKSIIWFCMMKLCFQHWFSGYVDRDQAKRLLQNYSLIFDLNLSPLNVSEVTRNTQSSPRIGSEATEGITHRLTFCLNLCKTTALQSSSINALSGKH